ncbi:hypothetical protein NKG94_37150 [Micromonospora sp. M12]
MRARHVLDVRPELVHRRALCGGHPAGTAAVLNDLTGIVVWL